MNDCITIQGLAKRYGTVRALQGIDLAIPAGEIFGLLGPNGSGKTTTLECVLGFRRADAGTARILGMDPERQRRDLFARTGVQFQDPAWPEKIRLDEACQVNDLLHRLPAGQSRRLAEEFGLENHARKAVAGLSGGEKQRLALVQAMAHRPEVLFLDEMTTGLDPEARRKVWDQLLEAKRGGATIFLTSHSMEEVEALCQRVAVLRSGRIAFLGSPAELKARSGSATLEQAYLAHLKQEASA